MKNNVKFNVISNLFMNIYNGDNDIILGEIFN